MKKNKLSLAAAIVASAIAFAPAGAAFADTTATTNGTVSFQAGSLSLSELPSNFDFGSTNVVSSGLNRSYSASDDEIAVSDLTGSGDGWNLQASLTAFSNENANQPLTGASVSFDQAATNQYSSALTSGSNSIESTNAATTVLSADSNQGMGTSTDPLSSIKLNLPDSTPIYEGSYSATMTWTLGNTPTASESGLN